jgi:predicted ATPase/DNA-binding CsgD family transcriptional regulator
LALQAASAPQPGQEFRDGTYFVPLQAVPADFLVPAILDALKLPAHAQTEPLTLLLDYLQDKELLLILDNFEHLAPLSSSLIGGTEGGPGGPAALSQILQAAPEVKLLVTSREVLSLQEEWLYPVEGLAYPRSKSSSLSKEIDQDQLQSYSAVQLFVERAQQLRRNFAPAAEIEAIIRICQLVEGAPLALELAAVWTKTLRCEAIAAEIEQNLDFLTTHLRNVPERQRSIRAVFEYSWQRLAPKEQQVYQRLSVFRGGFRREAAEQVAGASLAVLMALVDKSLLRPETDGRYQIHELLRQYAAEQLVLSPDDLGGVYDLHCAYYVDFLHQRLGQLYGGRQPEATLEIAAELENIRAAWQWAVELAKVEELAKAREALSLFFQFQGRYLESAGVMEKAIDRLGPEQAARHPEFMASMQVGLAWSYIRLGRLAEAELVLDQAQHLYFRHNPPPPGYASDPRLPQGILALIRGDSAEAARLGEEARHISETGSGRMNGRIAYYVLARAAWLQGDYPLAQQHIQQAYRLTQAMNDQWFMAYCLNELGNVARALGNDAAAKAYYQAGYDLRQAFNDPEGMAVALNHLGETALRQGDYAGAQTLYRQSLAIYRQINDQGGLATSLGGLAQVALAMGDYPAARQQFQQALEIAVRIQYISLILSLLTGVGRLLLQVGQARPGVELLAQVLAHPACDRQAKAAVQRLLAAYNVEALPQPESDRPADLEAIVSTVRVILATPLEETPGRDRHGDQPAQPMTPSGPRSDEPFILVESLSERELEVLRLVAAGLQNQEIAADLVVALSTVKTHINNIYRKLDVTNRVQAVSRAKALKLI